MSGQTLRENIEQEVQYLLEQQWGTAWGEEDWRTYQAIVDWAVDRAESDAASIT